jgi:hypothetical protein
MYETGSASGVVDLLTKLQEFLVDAGWTASAPSAEGAGARLHAALGGVHFNARAYVAETPSAAIRGASGSSTALAFNLSTASTGGAAWFDKTGTPVDGSGLYHTAGMNGITGAIPTYHFFSQNAGASILVVVEYASGYFQMLGFGTLNKYGAYTGGTYFFGSRTGVDNLASSNAGWIPAVGFFSHHSTSGQNSAPSFVSLTVDAETGWHWSGSYDAGRDTTKRYVRCNLERYRTTLPNQPNSLNDLTVLMPVIPTVEREIIAGHTAERLSPIGELPGVYYLRLKNLVPGQQVVLGSDEYRVFPFFRKTDGVSEPSSAGVGHSADWGFAVKE